MDGRSVAYDARNASLIRWLTYLMFMMFAMTSDAVGSVIPSIIKEFHLTMTAAGTFHYVPMGAIAVGALLLGFMADRFGRQRTIIVGLILYGLSSMLFAFGNTFLFFVGLLAMSGLGISIFKSGALALIGDISKSTADHSARMNTLEGFFALGSIIGPAIVATLLDKGMSWKWLYVIAAAICGLLILLSVSVRYPAPQKSSGAPATLPHALKVARNPYALAFSTMIMLYVAVEVAVYVWMPTYLSGYKGTMTWLPIYALTIFFILRAAGRFVGIWLLKRFSWTWIMALFSTAIFGCFFGSLVFGITVGAILLPLSGLFMSMIYPTLNSKGISCFPKSEHGAAAGVILFFTAIAAALGPLAMGEFSDAFGSQRYGFALATGFSFMLFVSLLVNLIVNPAEKRLKSLDASEYSTS